MKALRRSSTSSSPSSSSSPTAASSPPSSSWIHLRSLLVAAASSSSSSSAAAAGSTVALASASSVAASSTSSPASSSPLSDRGGIKSPWSRRKRKRALSRQQWDGLFSANGKLRDGGKKFLKKVRSGGIEPGLRAEVWPFLLGVYELSSSEEERSAIKIKKRKEYEKLRRQCQQILSCYRGSGLKAINEVNNEDCSGLGCSTEEPESPCFEDVNVEKASESPKELKPKHSETEQPENTKAAHSETEQSENTKFEHSATEQPEITKPEHRETEQPENTKLKHRETEQPENTRPAHSETEQPENTKLEHSETEQPENTKPAHSETEQPENTKLEHSETEQPENTKAEHRDTEQPEKTRLKHSETEQTESTKAEHSDTEQPENTICDAIESMEEDTSELNYAYPCIAESESSDSESSDEDDSDRISLSAEDNCDPDPKFSRSTSVKSDLFRSSRTSEDFVTWQRIIRLDAIRANAEWILFSRNQSEVSKEKALQSAASVGLKDYDHLEPRIIYHAARLVGLLEAYAVYDPEIGYCQGMSDLLSPIIAVMEEDDEAFWCFVGFMRKARHNFRLDEVGIRRQLKIVSQIIKRKDSHLYRHLQKLQAEDCFFVYRMVVVLFRRELTFEQTVCLWEVMWADQAAIRAGMGRSTWARIRLRAPPTDDLLLYAIAACVLQRRKLIIEKYSSMDEILRECNSMAGQLDVWRLLDDAHDLVVNLHDKV